MSAQRLQRPNIVQMLYKYYVFTGKRAYCSPPLPTVARSHAMGAGGLSNDGTTSLYCVRFYTHNP